MADHKILIHLRIYNWTFLLLVHEGTIRRWTAYLIAFCLGLLSFFFVIMCIGIVLARQERLEFERAKLRNEPLVFEDRWLRINVG